MIAILLIAAWSVNAAQADLAQVEQQKTYILILDSGEELPAWYEKRDNGYWVQVDNPPWDERKFLPLAKVKEIRAERKEERYRRIQQWYEAHGYVAIGEWKFYPAEEVAWAQRAREMAGVDAQPAQATAETAVASAAPAVPAPAAPPGLVVQWGAHTALVLISLLLITLVIRTLILAEA